MSYDNNHKCDYHIVGLQTAYFLIRECICGKTIKEFKNPSKNLKSSCFINSKKNNMTSSLKELPPNSKIVYKLLCNTGNHNKYYEIYTSSSGPIPVVIIRHGRVGSKPIVKMYNFHTLGTTLNEIDKKNLAKITNLYKSKIAKGYKAVPHKTIFDQGAKPKKLSKPILMVNLPAPSGMSINTGPKTKTEVKSTKTQSKKIEPIFPKTRFSILK